MAQPSLSEQVRRLEAELGVALFARAGRGLTPTEAGETLRPHAERTLAAAEAARESVVDVRELRGGIATFGTWGTARYYPGTDIVAAFRRRHPNVRVRLIGQNSFEVVEAVRRGDIEAGMSAPPPRRPRPPGPPATPGRGGPPAADRLDVQPIMRDEVVYASADARRLRRPMTIAALAQAPLILSDASWGTDDPTRRHLAQLAQQAGGKMEPQIDVEDVEAAIELAAGGLGDTIVARGMLLALGRRVPRRLGWVPFAEPLYDLFAFISRHGARLSPARGGFARLARERLETLARTLETKPPRRRRPGS